MAFITSKTRRVFLTGPTGYLGSHLLTELLDQTSATIRCLVRAGSAEDGRARVLNALAKYGLTPRDLDTRLEVTVGDLAKPQLGLSDAEFTSMAADVDLILHNGAQVNYVLSYNQLKQANVGGTQELVRVARAGAIPLAYISTLRLFDSRSDCVPIRESDAVDEAGTRYSGYSHSKWMAEKLIRSAARSGLRQIIFRPGLVCCGKEYPAANESDAVSLLIKGCLELGVGPRSELHVNLTPIDYVVKAILALLQSSDAENQTFHLVNDKATSCDRIMTTLQRLGHPLSLRPYPEWLTILKSSAGTRSNSLLPLSQFFTSDLPNQSRLRSFDSRATQSVLAPLGILPQAVDDAVLTNNIRSLVGDPRSDETATARVQESV